MKRRDFLIACAMTPFMEHALAESDGGNPFAKVGPFVGEAKTVFEFFSFSCTYCQQHQAAMSSWGRTVPRPVTFETVPVVVDRDTFNAARAYYAAQKANPGQINAYLQAALYAARSGYADMASAEILQSAGIGQAAFNKAMVHPDVKKAIERAAELTHRYQIVATPSLSIGGRMVIHADHVNGDYGLLMRLVSGFVSRILEAG